MTSIDALKEEMIVAGRILVAEDQGDLIFGHVTARLPDDPAHFLMKPHTIGLEEMTPDNIITVNLVVTCGRTVEEATILALHLEKACKIQLMVESCGGAKHVSTPEDAKAKKGRILPQSPQVFSYLKRRLCGHSHP
jgi:ribulose-5-phosphate 4-epimerase/fuculose-1-phosphate aldolase